MADRNRHLSTTLVLCVGLIAAGCSSDAKKSTDSTSNSVASSVAPTTTATAKPTTTTSEVTTTDVASSGDTGSTDVVTTDTVPPVPVYPLTGLPILDPVLANRPALVVKIDNHPDARPQSGLNEADIVFEENVEHLTRFAAVFHSNGADPVGPIRSGRTQDVDILGSLNKPIFAWSGGNARVSAAINSSDLVPVNETKAGKAMFRNKSSSLGPTGSPHNLYGDVSALYTFAAPDAGPPPQQFQYHAAGAPPTAGGNSDGVKVSMDGIRVRWQWDPGSGTYLRFSDEKVHNDHLTGAQLATSNVIVLYVNYVPSPADGRSPEAQTEGYGVAWVFTGGKYIQGSWVRVDRLQPFTLADINGDPILLAPGHTFIELSNSGKGAPIPAGADPASVQYP
jgi:Protein of unknown function (DUF3048) N-terminal domain/Protein of unknown function (DUF3048) C-terminal domain